MFHVFIKGLSVFGFSFFFVLPFGKELFHFKGGEEEEEDLIIKSTTQTQTKERDDLDDSRSDRRTRRRI